MAQIRKFSEADHALVTAAVGAAEKSTDGEIVTIVTEKSHAYRDVVIAWATAAAFLLLGLIAAFPELYRAILIWALGGWEVDFSAGEYLTMIFFAMVAKFVGVWLFLQWMPLRFAVIPRGIKHRRVRERAITLFKVGAERRTKGLTGILIYVSLAEHRAEIVADEAIVAKVAPEIWGDAMAALIDEIRAGRPGHGMAAAVQQIGLVLTEYFPKSGANPNELPDRLIEI
jgi:putative membrane protein